MRATSVLALLTLSTALAATPPQSGEVKGTVLDTRGRLISNAIIWIKPGVTTGLMKVRMDARGQYSVTALPNVPYNTAAWTQIKYRGDTFCLSVAAENEAQYAVFAGREGAVRNSRLKLSGPVPDTNMEGT